MWSWSLLLLVLALAPPRAVPSSSATSAPVDVSALFPGLGDLRRAQELKLRELLASETARHPAPPPPPPPPRFIDESRAPITNRPPHEDRTRRPDWTAPRGDHTDERPRWPPPRDAQPPPGDIARPPDSHSDRTSGGSVQPSGDADRSSEEPVMVDGPDDGLLSEWEWRRAVRKADDMCGRYEAAETRRVAATPLLPTPAPVSVTLRCASPSVPLVVGGAPVDISLHPHMAALGWPRVRARGFAWKCGGALVSERFVLTAAHCSYQDRDTTVVPGPPRAVQLGGSRLDEAGALRVRVARVVRHPRYRAPQAYYDLALLQLTASVTFSERVRPACVGEPPPPGESVVATGWGRTEYGGDMSAALRAVSLPVWPVEECARTLGASRRLPRGPDPEAQVCAGELRGGKDTCQGDSGGPAVRREGCSWRVVAVTSLGRACGAPDTPALYARALPAFVASVVWPDGDRRRRD